MIIVSETAAVRQCVVLPNHASKNGCRKPFSAKTGVCCVGSGGKENMKNLTVGTAVSLLAGCAVTTTNDDPDLFTSMAEGVVEHIETISQNCGSEKGVWAVKNMEMLFPPELPPYFAAEIRPIFG
jgi:hypothetical protein